MKRPRLYDIWNLMKQRCTNPNRPDFARYGSKGIKVCDDWLSYEGFKAWAMENGYADNLTIERKNNEGNYEPSNCRWATKREQELNKSTNAMVSFNGKTQTISQWAEELGINYFTLQSRITKRHWGAERALTQKIRGAKG